MKLTCRVIVMLILMLMQKLKLKERKKKKGEFISLTSQNQILI